MRFPFAMLLSLLLLLLTGCAVKKVKDVNYITLKPEQNSIPSPKLNIFVPRKAKGKKLPVLIFVHGGNWNTGNKNTYGFYGRNFAKKGLITVIPDYTLSPNANYDDMAKEIAAAIQWTKKNIDKYNGDPNQIFVTGHSAGGHLVALAVMNPKYGIDPKTISGIILNDAAGLDMKHYLESYPPTNENDYIATWTNNPAKWQEASPIYFIDKNTPPFLIYFGDKTYESIKTANERFLSKLHQFQPSIEPIHINKKHVPMITQYFWPWSKRFYETIKFIDLHKTD